MGTPGEHHDPHAWPAGRCWAYTQNSPLYPVATLQRDALGLDTLDDPEAKVEQLARTRGAGTRAPLRGPRSEPAGRLKPSRKPIDNTAPIACRTHLTEDGE